MYHHTPDTGLTSKIVYKDYDWEIPPVIGAIVYDSAWHRKDPTTIEVINITSDEGDSYYVELNPRKLENLNDLEKLVEIVEVHGWKVLFE